MTDIFKIKKGDTQPALAVTLQSSDGTAIDLNGGSVYFNLGSSNYAPIMSGLSVITGSSNGQVKYQWNGTTDTNNVGTFWGEFELINVVGGSRITLPSDHSLKIIVYEDYN